MVISGDISFCELQTIKQQWEQTHGTTERRDTVFGENSRNTKHHGYEDISQSSVEVSPDLNNYSLQAR